MVPFKMLRPCERAGLGTRRRVAPSAAKNGWCWSIVVGGRGKSRGRGTGESEKAVSWGWMEEIKRESNRHWVFKEA